VRKQALDALYNSLTFVKANFARDNERNIIMQVVCEGTQASDTEAQVSAYQCLIRIVDLYYRYMELYMKKALYGVTIFSMQSENERVVLQAIEFWSTLCEREYDLLAAEDEAYHTSTIVEEKCMYFARDVLKELVPVLFWLLTKQDEDADEDEWNPAMAAATCFGLLSQTVGSEIIQYAVPLMESNLRSGDWHHREAAVMIFGSILEGPEPVQLSQLVLQGLPFLYQTIQDQSPHVKDTAAWTLGRVCEFVIRDLPSHVDQEIMNALMRGLTDQPRIVASCCWALMNFAEQKAVDHPESDKSSPFFQTVVQALLATGGRDDNLNNIRTSAYEALSAWIQGSANDVFPVITQIAQELLKRLNVVISLPSPLSTSNGELVSNLCSSLSAVVRRLDRHLPDSLSDAIMETLLQMITVGASSKMATVLEDAFICIGAVASALDKKFVRFSHLIGPSLVAALQNPEEFTLCSVAIGVISDICRAMEGDFAQYSDVFMELLGNLLTANQVHKSVKPTIIMCFGDIALAIGTKFEKYLSPVMSVLTHAAQFAEQLTSLADQEYVEQLREAIVEALVGIVQALSQDDKIKLIQPWLPFIGSIMYASVKDNTLVEHHSRNVAGLLGDLAIVFRNESREVLSEDWVEKFITITYTNRLFTSKTRETARWAREQIHSVW
jgi:importin subunit beta-1